MPVPFTAIVATYNRPALLTEAIASIQAQTITDFECLVVDDGSGTAAAVMPADDDRFRLIAKDTNEGLAAAWNTGVGLATGDAVTFLDDDDRWTADRLAIAADGLARADVAVCGARWLDDPKPSKTRALEGRVHDVILDRFTPNMGRTAVRRSAMEPFDETYRASQDVEWWLRQSRTSTVTTVAGVGHMSRRHDGVRFGNGTRARIESGRRMLSEHAAYFDSHPRAKAFRLYRIGVFHHQLGEPAEARRALIASLRTRPSVRAARSLAWTRPGRTTIDV